jgi:hypothetical protein
MVERVGRRGAGFVPLGLTTPAACQPLKAAVAKFGS